MSAIQSAIAQLETHLSQSDALRLKQLAGLMTPDGQINLHDALKTLYPGFYKSPKNRAKTLTALRKFRLALATAAANAGIGLTLASDNQTRAEPNLRTLQFQFTARAPKSLEAPALAAAQQIAERPAVSALETNTLAEIADASAFVPPTGRPVNEERPLLRVFLVSNLPNRAIKNRLLKCLTPRLKTSTKARFEILPGVGIQPKRAWRPTAREEIQTADLCLLLLTPGLLESSFIAKENLPALLESKRALAIELLPISGLDTRGLNPNLFFNYPAGAFSQQPNPAAQDAFADALFHHLETLLTKPTPADARLQASALTAAEDALLKTDYIHNPGRPLGNLEKHAIEPISADPAYREDALAFFLRWLRNPESSPYCALLAEYGMGKTTTCKALSRRILELRAAGEPLPFPVYLDLRAVGNAARSNPSLEEILNRILAQTWKAGPNFPRTTARDLIHQIDTQGALIVWDGLDEVLVHLDPHAGQQFTRTLYGILPPRPAKAPANTPATASRLLISCRTHFFRTLRDQQTHFLAEGRDNLRPNQYSGFLLLPFNEEQIREYVRQTLPTHDPARVMETIAAVHNLRELAERPYTLSLIAAEIEGIEQWKAQGKRVTGVTLYRHVVLSWLERDTGKHHFTPDHKQALMESIAAELWRTGEKYWNIAGLEQWLIAFLAAHPDLAAHYPHKTPDLLKEDLRAATFLVRDDAAGGGQFRFAHTSIQEYFLAGYLRRALIDGNRDRWSIPIPSRETLDFLGQWLLEDGDAQSKANFQRAIKGLERLRDHHVSVLAFAYVVQAKKRGYPAPSAAGFQLPGADLSNWDIEGTPDSPLILAKANFQGANLRNAMFRRCNLEAADFTGALADRAEFLDSYVARSQWCGASLEGSLFRHCNLIETGFEGSKRNRTSILRDRLKAAPADAELQASSGHLQFSDGCAWSPDGTRALSASADHTLRVWDAPTGRSLLTLQGHSAAINDCAWSPDGTRVLSASDDNTVRIWDATAGRTILTLNGHSKPVRTCSWSPDGTRILSGSWDMSARTWSATTGDPLVTIEGHWLDVNGCDWSPDSTRIVFSAGDGTVRTWDATTGQSLLTLKTYAMRSRGCKWSPDGSRLLAASTRTTLGIWDAATGEALLSLKGHVADLNGCDWSPDGSRVLSASQDNTLRIWDAASGQPLQTIQASLQTHACDWSPDGARILSGGYFGLRIWDVSTGQSLLGLGSNSPQMSSGRWSPDGSRILTASWDGALRIWDVATGRHQSAIQAHSHLVTTCAWSPDGNRLLSGSDDKTLRIWDASSGKPLHTLEGHSDRVQSCAWSPEGNRVLSASHDQTLRIWDATTGRPLHTLEGHSDRVECCAWFPDRNRVLSASRDKTLRIWDALTGRCLLVLEGHSSPVVACAWSPKGSRVLSASWFDGLRIWDAVTGNSILTLAGKSGPFGACAWSPDGNRLLSTCDDHTVGTWDAGTGQPILSLRGHTGLVHACAWSPDSTRILSASHDGTLRTWDAASGRELTRSVVWRHPRSESPNHTDWATLDIPNNRILTCSRDAWRWLGYVTKGTAGHPPEWLYAESFGPLPICD